MRGMGEGARRDGEVDKEAPLFDIFEEFKLVL